MAQIDITCAHRLSPAKAKAAAERVGQHLADEFGIKYQLEDGMLRFERPGVNGHMKLGKDSVHIVVRLGLLLLPFRAKIEQEIKHNLEELFAPKKKTKAKVKS
jgi:putative polyhydroxyalkanoate system protein